MCGGQVEAWAQEGWGRAANQESEVCWVWGRVLKEKFSRHEGIAWGDIELFLQRLRSEGFAQSVQVHARSVFEYFHRVCKELGRLCEGPVRQLEGDKLVTQRRWLMKCQPEKQKTLSPKQICWKSWGFLEQIQNEINSDHDQKLHQQGIYSDPKSISHHPTVPTTQEVDGSFTNPKERGGNENENTLEPKTAMETKLSTRFELLCEWI